MSIAWSDVTNIAAELSTAPAALQAAILAQVNEEVNSDAWGTRADRARGWLAAHLATLALRKGYGGQLTGQTVGGVSRTFAAVQALTPFAATAYGAEYERQLMAIPTARIEVG